MSVAQSYSNTNTHPALLGEGTGPQLGAVDLGSNSFHLLIAQESDGRIQFLDKHKEMVRLAEGLRDDNTLDPRVVDRALACLDRFGQRLRPVNQQNQRIVGTNTLRKASNAEDFVRRAEEALGHPIEIISGREEARLIYSGVCHDLGDQSEQRMVVDIGGGSTELIIGKDYIPEALESLFMGCVSMSSKHFADGRVTSQAMHRAINDALVECEPIVQPFCARGWESVIGASGTINSISDVLIARGGADVITASALDELVEDLVAAGSVDALNSSGLSSERESVFAGGLAILVGVFRAFNIQRMAPAQSALREGLIYDLLGRQHHEDIRDATVQGLMQRFNIDWLQARQVRETALSLLSQVALDWRLTEPEDKLLIRWAADLHEIGMDIAHAGYHKHGGYLLSNMDMPGFSSSKQNQLARLVRVHRRRIADSAGLDSTSKLMRLAILLRLSAVFHRGRERKPLPHINLQAEPSSGTGCYLKLRLSLPQEWLATHPLTRLDLANEANFLMDVGVALSVTKHV